MGVELVLFNIFSVDCATHTATVEESLSRKALCSHTGVQLYLNHEVIFTTACPSDIVNGFAEFVEVLPGGLISLLELHKEIIGDFVEAVLMHPNAKGGTCCIIISCFTDSAKCPVHFEGSEPSLC